ncbi:hypothetical protein Dimus_001954 [Dionaea muscipula]
MQMIDKYHQVRLISSPLQQTPHQTKPLTQQPSPHHNYHQLLRLLIIIRSGKNEEERVLSLLLKFMQIYFVSIIYLAITYEIYVSNHYSIIKLTVLCHWWLSSNKRFNFKVILHKGWFFIDYSKL